MAPDRSFSREEWIERLLPEAPILARSIYSKLPRFAQAVLDPADLTQEASAALVRAVEHFDPSEADDVRALLCYRMKLGIVDYLRRRGPVRPSGSERHTAVSLDDGHYEFIDGNHAETTEELTRQRLELEDALKVLRPRERMVIRALFFENRTEADIGQQLGVSESRISQIKGVALDHIRAYIGSEEIKPDRILDGLSAREGQVLACAAEGCSVDVTAGALGISRDTVKTYRVRLLRKLGAENITNAVMIGFRRGILF